MDEHRYTGWFQAGCRGRLGTWREAIHARFCFSCQFHHFNADSMLLAHVGASYELARLQGCGVLSALGVFRTHAYDGNKTRWYLCAYVSQHNPFTRWSASHSLQSCCASPCLLLSLVACCHQSSSGIFTETTSYGGGCTQGCGPRRAAGSVHLVVTLYGASAISSGAPHTGRSSQHFAAPGTLARRPTPAAAC